MLCVQDVISLTMCLWRMLNGGSDMDFNEVSEVKELWNGWREMLCSSFMEFRKILKNG